ncbi:MAG TPA: hypothetical protein VHF51_17730 [Solirubrobacteraceae bacterium]|nr:hypothetical protein [Solirubrobacteraceae bacterium]
MGQRPPGPGRSAAIALAAHQEIVLAYGTPKDMPERPPASYEFAPGD